MEYIFKIYGNIPFSTVYFYINITTSAFLSLVFALSLLTLLFQTYLYLYIYCVS